MIDPTQAITLATKLLDAIATASEAYQRHRRRRGLRRAQEAVRALDRAARMGGLTSAEVRRMVSEMTAGAEEGRR